MRSRSAFHVLAAGSVLTAFVAALVAAPRPKPTLAVPPPTDPAATQATSRPSWPPIPPDVLAGMYKMELGTLFRAEKLATYRKAHDAIERYFEAPSAADRKKIVKELEGTGLPPGVVGRLCRIRSYWPELQGGGVYYVNERTGVHPTRYFFGVPANYDRAKSWPVVVKLPTADAFLTDPPPTAERVTEIYTKWAKDELAAHPDAVVVLPLLDLGELWGPSYAGMDAAMLPLKHVAGRVNLDPARVYLVGHSMSAHAVWNLSLCYPTYFAAVNPLAGGARADWQRVRAPMLRNVLPVVWHDADDAVVNVSASRDMVKVLRLQKVEVTYDETKGQGHVPGEATLAKTYDVMRGRTRDLYPASAAVQSTRPDTLLNRNDWLQVYQPLTPGKDHRAILRYGTGSLTYFDNVMRAEVTRKGNRIEVTTGNVDSLRLYLNDQMVDFNQAVTLMVNGRARFEGRVGQSFDEMMKDQLFVGRGWRYFSAVMDVELTFHPPAATRPATKPVTRPATRPATR